MSAFFGSIRDLVASCLCSSDTTLKLNGRQYRIVKVLGEGGFSFVYLAQDVESQRLFALKKIRCPLGTDSLQAALREVEAYKRFRHKNIIRCYDSCVVQDPGGEGKIVYLFLPYYKKGTVQDVMNQHFNTGSAFDEKDLLRLFLGAARGVRRMHIGKLETGKTSSVQYPPSSVSLLPDDDEEAVFDDNEGRALISGLDGALQEEREAAGDDSGSGQTVQKEIVSWAHRDIKPANIMLADDNTPILMDLGSAQPARIPVRTRAEALAQQDLAAEHCSMAYRAPELFDVRTGTELTSAVDIWSLGCTLFAMAYGFSPFETPGQTEQGGSVAMAAMTGKYTFPREPVYSDGLKNFIRSLLVVDPSQRPDIDEVISQAERLQGEDSTQ